MPVAIVVDIPAGPDALDEFVRFHDVVYAARAARWPAFVPFQRGLLSGDSPYGVDRRMRPLTARADGSLVARLVAVVDLRYQRHWRESLGHVIWFEALPDTTAATQALLQAACEWLAAEGCVAARAGSGLLEFPFTIDAYEALPPAWLRQNPAYYHALLKDAGFITERGFVDYRIEVRAELQGRWESALEAARRGGIEVVALRDVPEPARIGAFATLWNEAFSAHWGYTPFSEAEIAGAMQTFGPAGMLDVSVIAYRGTEPVGALWVVPETTGFASLSPGRVLAPAEQLNVLGIAVRAAARGQGVNLAMAAHAYLELVRRGATHLSYTLVLDDNWRSRRTAEKLGAHVCANYVAYRRDFQR